MTPLWNFSGAARTALSSSPDPKKVAARQFQSSVEPEHSQRRVFLRVERCLSHQCRTRARRSSRGAMKATFDLFPALEKRLRESTGVWHFRIQNWPSATRNSTKTPLRPIVNCEVPDPRREHGSSCSTPTLCESPGGVSPTAFVTPVRSLETPRHTGVRHFTIHNWPTGSLRRPPRSRVGQF